MAAGRTTRWQRWARDIMTTHLVCWWCHIHQKAITNITGLWGPGWQWPVERNGGRATYASSPCCCYYSNAVAFELPVMQNKPYILLAIAWRKSVMPLDSCMSPKKCHMAFCCPYLPSLNMHRNMHAYLPLSSHCPQQDNATYTHTHNHLHRTVQRAPALAAVATSWQQ